MVGEAYLSLLSSSFSHQATFIGNYSLGKLQSEKMVGGAKDRGMENTLGESWMLLWFP